jgi:hypothetical protein
MNSMKFNSVLIILVIIPLALHSQTSLFIGSGATFTCTGAPTVTVSNGKFTNNTTSFTPAMSSFVITGSASTANSTVGGSAETTFYNLEINKSSNDAQLSGNIKIQNQLKFTSKNLDLSNKKMTLIGATATLQSESASSHCISTSTGTVEYTTNLNAPVGVNPGKIGAAITSSKNLGSTIIVRGHQAQTVQTGITSIKRFYKITPNTNTALGAKLRLYYFDDELPSGVNENTLVIWRKDINGTVWTKITGVTRDPTQNWVETNSSNNQSTLAMFTLAPATTAVLSPPVGSAIVNDDQIGTDENFVSLDVFPNPADENINVQIVSSTKKEATLLWFDIDGKLLRKVPVTLEQGENIFPQDIASFPRGTIILRNCFKTPS